MNRSFIAELLRLGVLVLALGAGPVGADEAVHQTGAGRIEPPWAGGGEPQAELHLEVLLLQGSGWTPRELPSLAAEMAVIYAQCGIRLRAIAWRELRVAEPLLDFSTAGARRLVAAVAVPRPAVFLVRDTRQIPAFDAEAIGRGNSRTRPQLRDTVWVTRALPHPGVGVAHEVAHLLANSGAHDARPGNLMQADSAPHHTRLEPDQCARILEAGLAGGLLGPPARQP